MVAFAGAYIGGYISDGYSDRQRELELEASLISSISAGATELFQGAQDAARADTAADQVGQRDKAADKWVLQSGTITAIMNAYFESDDDVVVQWNGLQAALYDWAVLGCCTTPEGRPELIGRIRAYLDDYVAGRPKPPPTGVTDPWAALNSCDPPPAVYQWLGLYLLRGRGELLKALKTTDAQLD